MNPARGTVTIRRGQIGDADGIAAAYVETWRATYPGLLPDRVLVGMNQEGQARYWQRLLAARQASEFVYVAAGARGKPIGFGSAGPGRKAGPYGEIYTLYVRPDFQGTGIGRALLQALLAELAERGATSAMLWVLAQNPSRFFYERVGGVKILERTERLWGMNVPQIGYQWSDLKAR